MHIQTIDSNYLYIGVASFLVIAVYMVEHENASRAYKGLAKKTYAHHFSNMFFVVFFCIVVLFAYISVVPAIYCAARLVKGWLGFSLLSQSDKRKLDAELIAERRKMSIEEMLGDMPFNGGPGGSWNIPPQANYQQAMAYLAIWFADNYHAAPTTSDEIESAKQYWLSLRYSTPSNNGLSGYATADTLAKSAALANALPAQVQAYCDFLNEQNANSAEYWPKVAAYVSSNLQNGGAA